MKVVGRLHVITDTALQTRYSHGELAALAIRGGADVVQYRQKGAGVRQMLAEALEVQAACLAAGVAFIVNDRVDVALAVGAAGIHLGQEDLPVPVGRRLMPAHALIGASARTEELILAAIAAGADYIGYGPIFATATKTGLPEPRGLDGLERMCRLTSCPVVAIGGITAETAASCLRAGAHGVAVIGAVCGAPDPQAATQRLADQIRRLVE